ncbi:MAG: TraR/DksA family transcriptional regulator [Bdellovibrionales bacterium]|jgi:DnaK suppressor protein|nr:TraR/DksA family transcriptional regulator [Bdellovibrionales bacterium]MBT3525621.1 TraR/DksA family transcriptional regulator [Bdellovibrionales bacterium]MBT7668982.1 TraR/DksA family transcriptional regulator [Bdellovibrionales bacterium]MBT7767632.1 TraR/DksA family transcriptional regulator [Bdellovibrionales bacterium]
MKKKDLEHYRKLLLNMKSKILNGGVLTSNQDLTVSPEDLPDDADLANTTINQQVTFNIRQRELDKIRSIEEALYRIDQGSYGKCDDCDETIGAKRLERQPWATLCITHAEEREREYDQYSKSA